MATSCCHRTAIKIKPKGRYRSRRKRNKGALFQLLTENYGALCFNFPPTFKFYTSSRGEAAVDADQLHEDLLQGGTARFKPDKGFAGAEATANVQRDAPVQFERGGNK